MWSTHMRMNGTTVPVPFFGGKTFVAFVVMSYLCVYFANVNANKCVCVCACAVRVVY